MNPLSCAFRILLCLYSLLASTEAWVQSALAHCHWLVDCLRPAAFILLWLLHFDVVLGATPVCALISLVLHEAEFSQAFHAALCGQGIYLVRHSEGKAVE